LKGPDIHDFLLMDMCWIITLIPTTEVFGITILNLTEAKELGLSHKTGLCLRHVGLQFCKEFAMN
jgi:hypothetical protein